MTDDGTQVLVAGRYVLERRLGSGGMGDVWAGTDSVLGRPVAIKTVRLDGERAAALRQRVLREGRAAARIDHPASVRVYDVVEQDDQVALVMELVEAPTLKEEVRRDGPLEPREAARVGLAVLAALTAAHAAGIVHRDVKPDNVLVLADGNVKLADFGIASLRGDPNITSTGMVLGTPAYLAPEAARGERAGVAADLWGLGATVYFAVEGVAPFDRAGTIATLHAVLHDEPRPPERAGPLAGLLRDLLAKSPGARPDATEVRERLEDVHAGRALSVTPTVAAPQVAEPAARADRRWLGAVVAVLVLAAVAGVALVRSGGDDGRDRASLATSTTTTGAATSSSTGEAASVETTAVDRPGGRYRGPNFTITLPEGWREVERAGAAGVRFEGPDGSSLLVDSVSPPSDDPVTAWQRQEAAFRARRPSYARVALRATEYRGYDAALWEYTYEGLHADDLGFVVGDTGYALNFVTGEAQWERTAAVREAFRRSFQPSAA